MMLRRFIVAGLAATMAVPAFVITPASAAILFTCPSIDASSNARVLPGLRHTQTAQDVTGHIPISTPCSNGEVADIAFGSGWGYPAVTTFGPRPLGCPVAWGGAGPDYPDQKPILLGETYPSLRIFWEDATSHGIAKVKAGATGVEWKIVLSITSGAYAPPAGQKTKIKGAINIAPSPGVSYTCADDSDSLELLALSSAGSLIVKQE